jgi:hypothetical protein
MEFLRKILEFLTLVRQQKRITWFQNLFKFKEWQEIKTELSLILFKVSNLKWVLHHLQTVKLRWNATKMITMTLKIQALCNRFLQIRKVRGNST